jgi:putative ABC transport system permease protein
LHEAEHKETAANEDEHDHSEEQEITAILWTPTRLGYAYQLANELNQGQVAQGVFPGQVIGQLFSFMGQGQEAYNLIIWLALFLAVLTIAINTLSASQVMQRNLAVLRAIGASKNQVVILVLLEALVITVVGLLVGFVLTYLMTSVIQQWLELQTALTLPKLVPNLSDLLRVASVIPVALVFALLPALWAIKNSPLKQMQR